MGRMRYPSLSLHGIEGAFYGAGAKTVIPAKVSGKFSIRYVSHYVVRVESLLTLLCTQPRPATDSRQGQPAGVQVCRGRVQEAWNKEQAHNRGVARRQAVGRGPQALEL